MIDHVLKGDDFYDGELTSQCYEDNAGYGYYMPLLDVDIEKARKEYDVNVWGLLEVTQAFFPLLRIAKGTVLNAVYSFKPDL